MKTPIITVVKTKKTKPVNTDVLESTEPTGAGFKFFPVTPVQIRHINRFQS